MPSPAMLFNLLLDALPGKAQPRVPEPQLLMDDAAGAAAFMQAGREDGILAHTYLYHAIQASAVIPRGGRVLDLGCGPANQLAVLAQLNRHARFIGIDAADSMLTLAEATLERCGLDNVTLQHASMESLEGFERGSMDAVVCSMSLHHLADTGALAAAFAQMKRVLKPGGGLYVVDFGRLRRERGQAFFAHERRQVQPPLFTEDYYNSLRAAFSLGELTEAARVFGDEVRIERTFLVPFLVAIRGGPSAMPDAACRAAAETIFARFSAQQRRDFRDLVRFFAHGGFALPFKPWQASAAR